MILDDGLIHENNTGLTMVSGAVIEGDYVYVAQYMDKYEKIADETELSILSQVDVSDKADPWGAHSRPWRVVSVCVWRRSDGTRLYVSLSAEGEVELLGPGGRPTLVEHIDGAGLNRPWSGSLGYLTAIRQIGQSIYACGGANQIYRRTEENTRWTLLSSDIIADPALLASTSQAMQGIRHLLDIGGISETDIYAIGLQGEIQHFDGSVWTKIDCQGWDENLTALCLGTGGDVYITGARSTLMKGNADSGFRQMWPLEDEAYFTGIALFDELVFLASVRRGLYVFDPATSQARRYATGLVPEFLDPHQLETRDGVLWCFGHKDLAFFDGKIWTRVEHPDNPPIGLQAP